MIEAIADRILIKEDEPKEDMFIPGQKPSITGEVVSIGPECNVNFGVGDKVVFKKSIHPSIEGLIVLREDQILAVI